MRGCRNPARCPEILNRVSLCPRPAIPLSVAHGTQRARVDGRRVDVYLRAAVPTSPQSRAVARHHVRAAPSVRSQEILVQSDVAAPSSVPTTYIRDKHPALVQTEAIPESVLERIR